jgi:hypothetical protein
VSISSPDLVGGFEKIAEDSCPIFARFEEMLDGKGEVLRESVFPFDEPRLRMEPGLPLGELHLFGQNSAALGSFREHTAGNPPNAFSGQRDTRGERSSRAQQQHGTRLVRGT